MPLNTPKHKMLDEGTPLLCMTMTITMTMKYVYLGTKKYIAETTVEILTQYQIVTCSKVRHCY